MSERSPKQAWILEQVGPMVADLLKCSMDDDDLQVSFLDLGANSLTHMEMIRGVQRTFGVRLALRQFFDELLNMDDLIVYLDEQLPEDVASGADAEALEPSAPAPASNPAPVPAPIPVAPVQQAPRVPVQPLPIQPVPVQPMPVQPVPVQPNASAPSTADGELEQIFAAQLQAATHAVADVVARQLAYLGHAVPTVPQAVVQPSAPAAPAPVSAQPRMPDPSPERSLPAAQVPSAPPAAANPLAPVAPKPVAPPAATPVAAKTTTDQAAILPPWKIAERRARGMNDRQRAHLEALIVRYNARTAESKRLTQEHRRTLADNRASAGLRLATKEMVYPLIGQKARGSRIWDVDGNEYVDLTMGFGSYIFGHQPDFITEALQAQLDAGIQIGPQTALAGEVAELFREIVGCERVCFCNTGTEAVMAALRLARAATGRRKVVIFEGSYHGHFDGTLGLRDESGNAPIAPGILPGMVEDLIILDYGAPEALDTIRRLGTELAAVLVEPVQSRRPEWRPRDFLQALRAITHESGAALIFDEMITGFRLHLRGAQGYFGVEADLATYGKIAGGGMPIGIVAGKARILDALDGGFWSYGDASYPMADTTFFAGTFNKHPMALAASRAVLQALKREGEGLQERLTERTARFAARLNQLFEAEEVPIQVEHAGSQFRFAFSGNMDLLFFHLVDKGIFIWEGRNCFLSAAHDDEDVETVVRAIEESLEELRGGHFLPPRPGSARRIPLSEAQRQLWIPARLGQGGSLAYHVASAVAFVGPLDVERLSRALRTVVERHDALRTVIGRRGEWQRILPAAEVELDRLNVPTAEVDAWLDAEAEQPFDLEHGPLFRAALLRLGPDEHVLALSGHHIVLDGASLSLIVDEIGRLYDGPGDGGKVEDAASFEPVSFERFVHWQEVERLGEDAAHHEAFWLDRLQGPLPSLDLVTDRPRPDVFTFHGNRRLARLTHVLEAKAGQAASSQGASLFMLLFAAYQALLARLTGQRDLIVGTPVAGRGFDGGERAIGYFTHLLPIRLDIRQDASFGEHLRQVRNALLDAFDHQDYPFARLLERVLETHRLVRDPSRLPVVQTVFNVDRAAAGEPRFAGLGLAPVPRSIRFCAFELGLNLIAGGAPEETKASGKPGVRDSLIECDYNTDLFDVATIDRLLRSFERLLEHAVDAPETPLTDLRLLSQVEADQLRAAESGPPASAPEVLPDLLARAVALGETRTAVVCGEEDITYGELARRAESVARRLRQRGNWAPEMRVGLCAEPSIEMIVGLVGILLAGGAYVPLDPSYPRDRRRQMLRLAGADRVLVRGTACLDLEDGADLDAVERIRLDGEIPIETEAAADGPTIHPENLAYVIFTSGSTGEPKGVGVSHGSACNLARAQVERYSVEASSRVLQYVSLTFDVASGDILMALAAGAALVVVDRQRVLPGPHLLRTLSEARITHAEIPAAILSAMPVPGELPDLHTVAAGGEVCTPRVIEQWSRTCRLLNAYGPTEATVCATVGRLGHGGVAASIGWPLAGVQVKVLDRRGFEVLPGVPGELCIRGAGLARGYLGRPAQTAQVYVPNPFGTAGDRLYRTGDQVIQRPDGELIFLGRTDDQVKVRGHRVELGEIEAVLRAHPSVREAAVDVQNTSAGDRLVAYLVRQPGADAPNWRDTVAAALPLHMVPGTYHEVAAMPLTAHGKVDRRALASLEVGGVAVHGDAVAPAPASGLEARLRALWSEILHVDEVGLTSNFFDLGGHSLHIARLQERLEEELGRPVPVVDLFRHPTVVAQARHFSRGETGGEAFAPAPAIQEAAVETPAEGRELAEPDGLGDLDTAVAIIGMAGRFPGAADVEVFWHNLRHGVESIRVLTDEELIAAGGDPDEIAQPNYVKARAVLDDIDLFDASFFGYSPRQAEEMDPQHRLLLETAWQALENAGYDSSRYEGRIGVFAGVGLNTYLLRNLLPGLRFDDGEGLQFFLGNDKDFAPTKVAYQLDLRGPAINVNTACSSSLTAVELACQNLLGGRCEMALAGGVAVLVPQMEGYTHHEGSIDSPDGHCRAFDARAQGTVSGSGAGLVVLKRYRDAVADGDRVLAVVRGSAMNNDGADKVGFTAPGVDGQVAVIRQALATASVEPSTVSYVEAHGTGTPLGDPIEIAALRDAFTEGGDLPEGSCAIGSVKSNVGHLDTAAGVTGLIKTVLALEHGEIPPSLHFETPNPKLGLEGSPFRVASALEPWQSEGPRRAGVSSFGIGGTNVHVVLEEAPSRPRKAPEGRAQILPVSARSEAALEMALENLAASLEGRPDLPLADAAWTLQMGRRAFAERAFVVAATPAEAAAALRNPASIHRGRGPATAASLTFLFSGQGSQYAGMGRALDARGGVFRQVIDDAASALSGVLDLRQTLLSPASASPHGDPLRATALAQPALFAFEVALARQWMAWGLRPTALAGHSLGELAAACVAGVMDFEDALEFVVFRGQVMAAQPPGVMLAVPVTVAELENLLVPFPELSLAVINGPRRQVVSGPDEAITRFETALAERGARGRRLATSHAFHSTMMQPVVEPLVERLGRMPLKAPRIPMLSNLSGTWMSDAEAQDPEAWARRTLLPVRFAENLSQLLADRERTLLEVGPGQALAALARRHPSRRAGHRTLASLPAEAVEREAEEAFLARTLGQLWLAGQTLDWAAIHGEDRPRRTALPTYPFERRRFWREPPTLGTNTVGTNTLGTNTVGTAIAEARVPESSTKTAPAVLKEEAALYLPGWQSAPAASGSGTVNDRRWLVFYEPGNLGERLADRLSERGGEVVRILPGEGFADLGNGRYLLRHGQPESMRQLASVLGVPGAPWHVVDVGALGDSRGLEGEAGTHLMHRVELARIFDGSPEVRVRHWSLLTRGLCDVFGHETLVPERAVLRAPMTVIPQEIPGLSTSVIDLDDEMLRLDGPRLDPLLEELVTSPNPLVAWRRGRRWVETFSPLPATDSPSALREHGVYWILGGLGKVGQLLAEHLARTVRARLVLTSRHEPTAEQHEAMARLEALGAEVFVTPCDVVDEDRLREVLQAIDARYGALHGIVHAAGVTGNAALRMLTEVESADVETQLQAKAYGTEALDRALGERPLDFCLMMSSLSTVLGGLGMTAYAAGNHVLEAFTVRRARRGGPTPWIAVAWDGWRTHGDADSGLTPEQGVRLFEAALRHKPVRAVAALGDLEARRRQWLAGQSTPATMTVETPDGPAAEDRPPELTTPYAMPEGEIEPQIAAVWSEVLGVRRVGRHDDFSELGGDSLIAVQVISRLRETFDHPLTVRDLFERPTVEALAEHLEQTLSVLVYEEREEGEL